MDYKLLLLKIVYSTLALVMFLTLPLLIYRFPYVSFMILFSTAIIFFGAFAVMMSKEDEDKLMSFIVFVSFIAVIFTIGFFIFYYLGMFVDTLGIKFLN